MTPSNGQGSGGGIGNGKGNGVGNGSGPGYGGGVGGGGDASGSRWRSVYQFRDLVADGHGEPGSFGVGTGHAMELLQRGRVWTPIPGAEEHHGVVAFAAALQGV